MENDIVKAKLASVTLTAMCLAATWALAGDKAASGEQEKKPYPLKTCVVSGEKLGSMGDAYVFKHKDQEIRLCCKGCLKDFLKDPEKYHKKLAEARKQKADTDRAGPAAGHEEKGKEHTHSDAHHGHEH